VYLVSDFLLQYSEDGSVSCYILHVSEMIVCEGLHMAKLTPKSYMCYHAVFSPVRINGPHHTHIRRCMYYNSVVMFSPVRIDDDPFHAHIIV